MITAIIYNTSTGNILSRIAEVDENNPSPLHPDLKYFIPYIPYPEPNPDARYYDKQYSETPVNIPHPIYPQFDQWLIEYPLVKRSNEDIFKSIENAERLANATIIKQENQLSFFANGILLFFKRNAGVQLTPEEEQSILDMSVKCEKIVTNRQIAQAKKDLVLLGQEPDIDALWEKE